MLFWSDWDPQFPRIERSSMSGDHRAFIVTVSAVPGAGWPNGIAVDYEISRIYWIDARSVVYEIDLANKRIAFFQLKEFPMRPHTHTSKNDMHRLLSLHCSTIPAIFIWHSVKKIRSCIPVKYDPISFSRVHNCTHYSYYLR